MVAISADELTDSQDLAKKLGLTFPLISDVALELIKRWGVFDAGNEIAWPAIFLVDAKGTVRWRSLLESYKVRPASELVLNQLDEL